MKRVMFTVYREYFDLIELGTKVIEYRDPKKPWLSYLQSPPDEAVFVCGRRRLHRQVTKVDLVDGKVRFHLNARGETLVRVLEECHGKFQGLLNKEANTPEFWLNLLHQQVLDGRGHVEADELTKYANELADCFSIVWQALRCAGVDPEPFIVARVRTRIIPHAEALAERDRAGNGYKPAAPTEGSS